MFNAYYIPRVGLPRWLVAWTPQQQFSRHCSTLTLLSRWLCDISGKIDDLSPKSPIYPEIRKIMLPTPDTRYIADICDLDKGIYYRPCVHTYKRCYELGFKTQDCCGFIYNKSRVYDNYIGLQENYLDQEFIGRTLT